MATARAAVALFAALLLGACGSPAASPTPVPPPVQTAPACAFQMGFADVQRQIPEIVGECVDNERAQPSGDSHQRTTKGLLVWRKADGAIGFTDGHRTWVRAPDGAILSRLNEERFPFEPDPPGVTLRVVQPPSAAAAAPKPVDAAPAPAPAQAPPPPAAAAAAGPAVAVSKPAAPAAAKPAADANRGIVFGKPVKFAVGGLSTVAVPLTNSTQQVKSFTVKATYKNGDQILATAVGAVNDIRPGQMRVATLLSPQPVPDQFESVRVDVDTMVGEAATTPAADAAAKITFGQPAIQGAGGFTTVAVEATNGDTAGHSFMVQAAFMNGDEVIGLASGAVNDLGAGQTKTASLLVQGATTGHDRVVVAVDTLVQ